MTLSCGKPLSGFAATRSFFDCDISICMFSSLFLWLSVGVEIDGVGAGGEDCSIGSNKYPRN